MLINCIPLFALLSHTETKLPNVLYKLKTAEKYINNMQPISAYKDENTMVYSYVQQELAY